MCCVASSMLFGRICQHGSVTHRAGVSHPQVPIFVIDSLVCMHKEERSSGQWACYYVTKAMSAMSPKQVQWPPHSWRSSPGIRHIALVCMHGSTPISSTGCVLPSRPCFWMMMSIKCGITWNDAGNAIDTVHQKLLSESFNSWTYFWCCRKPAFQVIKYVHNGLIVHFHISPFMRSFYKVGPLILIELGHLTYKSSYVSGSAIFINL